MRGSSLTTFLMFLPLIAIPLLAIFGVPEFTPVNASTPVDPVSTNAIAIDDPVRRPGAPNGRGLPDANDVFAPVDSAADAAPGFPGRSLKPEADPFLNKRPSDDGPRKTGKQGLRGWEIDQDRSGGPGGMRHRESIQRGDKRSSNRVETSIQDMRPRSAAAPAKSAGMQSVASVSESAEPAFTWQKAVRTLNRLGIKDFLLQPGSRSEEFHFSCLYSSPDNPRIAHRFEAEDAEPLRAVQKVLKQIQSRQ
jgi:hypothetical protein